MGRRPSALRIADAIRYSHLIVEEEVNYAESYTGTKG
jgi:hypothetical protein